MRLVSPWLMLPAVVVVLSAGNPAAGAPRPPVRIGTGSGHLSYPDAQATLRLQPGDTLHINPGTYSGLSLGNLSGSADAPITVVCDDGAVFTTRHPQPNEFPNIAHVRFENFRFEDYNGTCFHISGRSHDLEFRGFRITNASGWSFRIHDPGKVFDGTKESTFYNFKWEDMVVDGKVNGAAISSSDYQPVSNLVSVLLDFEVVRCTFRNWDNGQQAFPVIGLDKCFNLQVHECTFSDIGMAAAPIGHNVCICGAGYFKVWNNRFTRHWANDVRVWPMKLNALGHNGPDAVNRYYNNLSWEKRKYPAFEHNRVPQSAIDGSSGYLSPTRSEVCFNTLYRSRTAADSGDPYVGQLVDVYSPGVTIKHNLIIEPEADTPHDPDRNHVYHLGAGPQPDVVVANNLVFRTLEEAGLVDATGFVPSASSPVRDSATARVDYITRDHNGVPRYVGAAGDVGAVERQEDARSAPTAGEAPARPLFKQFMGINGHFTFKPDHYYDDNDAPSVHGSSGLTRQFVPKMSFWAVRQLHEVLGEFRFRRVVRKSAGELCVHEFEAGDGSGRVVWAAWSPTGTRTHAPDAPVPHEARVTLDGLPSIPAQVRGMATADGPAPQAAWESTGPSAITLKVGESPVYIIMEAAGRTGR